MKKIKKILNENKKLIAILIFALLIRLFLLNLNPVGITHDEVHDIINAKSIASTGNQAPGTVAGILTQKGYCDSNCVFGELVSFLLVPWMVVSPLDLFWVKIPFIIASLGIVFFTAKIFEQLSGRKSVGLITAVLMAINPWAIHFGRSAYENLFTYLFYLWGIYLFIQKKGNFLHLLKAFLICVLGFLSYFGAKPLLPFIVIIAATYNTSILKFKNLKQAIIISVIAVLFTAVYLFILNNSEAGLRLKELKSSEQNNIITHQVDNERKTMLQPLALIRDLSINKYSAEIDRYIEVYLGAFSPVYLFNKGEQGLDVFMISRHAYLYLIDFPFILLGIMAIGLSPIIAFFLLGLTAIQPLPSLVSAIHVTYALRAGLMFPLLVGLSAWGIYWLYKRLKKPIYQRMFIGIIIAMYTISFINFSLLYWYKTPFEKNIAWFYHERILIKYLTLNQEENKNVIVVSKSPMDLSYILSFFGNTYSNPKLIKESNEKFRNKDFSFANITIISDCSQIDPYNLQNSATLVIEQGVNCKNLPQNKNVKITNTKDSGEMYKIYNDNLCSNIPLQRYLYPESIFDFSVERMKKEEFCKKWITDPTI